MQRMDRLRPFTPQRCVSEEIAHLVELRCTNEFSHGVPGARVESQLASGRHASCAKHSVRTMLACLAVTTLVGCGSGGAEGLDEQILGANSLDASIVDAKGTPETKPIDDFGSVQANALTTVSKSGSAGLVNSVDTIIEDMSLENDAKLDGIPDFAWATGPYPAAVMMGADPRGCRMHSWWLDRSTVNAAYKDCDLWTALVQWFIVYEGVGNAAHNVRVETRRPRSYYLSRSTGTWNLIGQHAGTSWFLARKSDITHVDGAVDAHANTDGSVAVRVPVGSPYVYHGVWPLGNVDISDFVGDMAALYTTVQARLVVDDPGGTDDRSKAILLMHSGADYYPHSAATAVDSFPPSAGVSRSKMITSEWQSFNFATISAAQQNYTGTSASIPTDVFRTNPPPLE